MTASENHPNSSSTSGTGRSQELIRAIGQSVFGQEDLITETLVAFLAGGHILMTGAPGLAKTTLVKAFARQFGIKAGRIQFTPDLLPGDVIGSEVLMEKDGKRRFEFVPGPVFANLLLADEINRASPRTQSALLEAMQERMVTVAGVRHRLPQPFMVLATQNPFESEGTFPLPEAQLDRFLMHTLVNYPTDEAELRIMSEHAGGRLFGEQTSDAVESGSHAMGAEQVDQLLQQVRAIRVDDELLLVMKDLVRSTRPADPLCPEQMRADIWYGASPRAGIGLVSATRALALLEGSPMVRWRHVKRLAKPVLRHRIRLTARAYREGRNEDQLIEQLLARMEERYTALER